MGVLKGDARLACVDLSNYAERKHEITKQLMEAATTVGCVLTSGIARVRLSAARTVYASLSSALFVKVTKAQVRVQFLLRDRSRYASGKD